MATLPVCVVRRGYGTKFNAPGYSALDNRSLFIGDAHGETNGIGISALESDGLTITGMSYLDVTIKEKGPFVGASYIYYPDRPGSLSFSVAYAQLDGEVSIMRTTTLVALA